MKIQYVGDGTATYQTFNYPGGRLEKWQSFTATEAPEWVISSTRGTFLVDGKPNPGPSVHKPEPPAKVKPKVDKTKE